jgi:hypothetical protein
MPPLSYVITAILLAVLVAVSIPMTLGFSIILWYWSFAVAACILTIAGVFRVVGGLRAPLWLGVVLALPGFVWAANTVCFYIMTRSVPGPGFYYMVTWAAYIALILAAIGALRLIEIMSTPHAAFRIGYGVLVASALLGSINLVAYTTGWTFAKNALYDASEEAVGVAATLVKYGAFIGATILIVMRRNIERWTGATIIVILLYEAISQLFQINLPARGDGPAFWLEPVVMLFGGAAVWRIGSVLRAQQAFTERSVPLNL